jgi:hypothetical protein
MLSMVGVFVSWVIQSIVNMVGVPTKLVTNTIPGDFDFLWSRPINYTHVVKAGRII